MVFGELFLNYDVRRIRDSNARLFPSVELCPFNVGEIQEVDTKSVCIGLGVRDHSIVNGTEVEEGWSSD
jgi:hypothetical protein